MRANARPARRAGPIVRLHNFARSGPTKEAHRRAINRSGGLLRSVAGWGRADGVWSAPYTPAERQDRKAEQDRAEDP
jgi:hypothetical protein